MELVPLDSRRKKKECRCPLCGGEPHDFHGQCPRIHSITEETDGSFTYHLIPPDDGPKDAA